VPAATPVLLNLSVIAAAWWARLFERWGIEPILALAGGVMLGGCCSWRCRCRRWRASAPAADRADAVGILRAPGATRACKRILR
jgi:hypothetical protein